MRTEHVAELMYSCPNCSFSTDVSESFFILFYYFFKLPAFKAPVNAVIDTFGSCSSVNSVARPVVDVGIYSSDQNLLNLSPLTLTHYQDDDSGN